MEIQQHDGVVVDVAGLGRASPSFCERERCSRGGGRRPRLLCYCPPSPPLYRPPGRGAPAKIPSREGAAAKGGNLSPKSSGAPPHPRVSNPRRRGEAHGGCPSPLWAGSLPTSAHGALRDRWPHPVDPRDPSGGPGTIPVTPETFPVAET